MLDNSSAPAGAVITITPLEPRMPLLGSNALVSYDAAAEALVLSVPTAPVHSVDAIDAYLVELFDPAGGRAGLLFPASEAGPWSQPFTPALFPALWPGGDAPFTLGYQVRAHSKHGYGIPSARGEVEIKPLARPSLIAPPVVSGDGKIGSPHGVAGHDFTGADAVSIQWYRGSAPIAGAVAASYTPVAADDLAELSVVATASNSAGSVTAKSNVVRISYPAPVASGAIAAQSFTQSAGARFSVATAAGLHRTRPELRPRRHAAGRSGRRRGDRRRLGTARRADRPHDHHGAREEQRRLGDAELHPDRVGERGPVHDVAGGRQGNRELHGRACDRDVLGQGKRGRTQRRGQGAAAAELRDAVGDDEVSPGAGAAGAELAA